jgi:hypothetical protein
MWQYAPLGADMNEVLPHMKNILENYTGKDININKIERADKLDIIKEQNIYIKKYLIKNILNAGFSMCVYRYIYIFYNIRGVINIYDIKNNCYYCYYRDKDIDNNIIKMYLAHKFNWITKTQKYFFIYKLNFLYKDKIKIDKYKSNNKLIYIFGLSLI